MSSLADSQILEADDIENNIVEDAISAIEDVKQKFNHIRSRRLLIEAVHRGGPSAASSTVQGNDSDNEECVSVLEDSIDRLCIQESALKLSLENDTIHKIRSSNNISSELQKLLDLHLQQQVHIVSLSSELLKEYSKLQKAQSNLQQNLEEYMAYENKQSRQLKENSLLEDKEPMEKVRKRLREIRFMQLVIPHLLIEKGCDFTDTEWLGKLCQETRDPILSLDDLQ